MEPTQFNNNGNTLASPWKFSPHGESGIPVSELFPHVAQHVDKLAVIRSMTSNFPEHTAANYFLHTGTNVQGRPSMGAWLGYGLGSECQDLPGFVVINGGLIPVGGLDNFASGFLPASYQGSIFTTEDPPVANIVRQERSERLQRNKLALLRELDQQVAARLGHIDAVESAIANYELAYRMQTAVPGLMRFSDETEVTRRQYGFDATTKGTASFARQCLLARRLVERGVRFVELTCPNLGHDRWDQHRDLEKGHADNAKAVDQPIAALLEDLSQRGLLEETLVVWSGERRCQRGDNLRTNRRVRLQGRRKQTADPRPARDDAALARPRPYAADLPLLRPRHAADRRAWACDSRDSGLTPVLYLVGEVRRDGIED
jgi:hypothetical protein